MENDMKNFLWFVKSSTYIVWCFMLAMPFVVTLLKTGNVMDLWHIAATIAGWLIVVAVTTVGFIGALK